MTFPSQQHIHISREDIENEVFDELEGVYPGFLDENSAEIHDILGKYYLKISGIIATANSKIAAHLAQSFPQMPDANTFLINDITQTVRQHYYEQVKDTLDREKRAMQLKVSNIINTEEPYYIPEYPNNEIINLQKYVLLHYGEMLTREVREYLEPFYEEIAGKFEDIIQYAKFEIKKVKQKNIVETIASKKQILQIQKEFIQVLSGIYRHAKSLIDGFFNEGKQLY